MNTQSIHDHYAEDHNRLDELFYRFQSLKTSDRKQALQDFLEFRSGLERHIVWEEEILFPSFEKRFGQRGGPTDVMRWEHGQIRSFLTAIAEKLESDDFDTELEEESLRSVLCPHNEKEENILYPMIDSITAAEERNEIFAEMSRRS